MDVEREIELLHRARREQETAISSLFDVLEKDRKNVETYGKVIDTLLPQFNALLMVASATSEVIANDPAAKERFVVALQRAMDDNARLIAGNLPQDLMTTPHAGTLSRLLPADVLTQLGLS